MAAATKRAPAPVLTDEEADAANPAVAEAEAALRVRPDGMPSVLPIHALPRARQADVLEALAPVMDGMTELQEVESDNMSPGDSMRTAAKMKRLIGAAVSGLAAGANSPDKFSAWASKQTDEVILQAFAWYMGTLQPGEAGGSQ